jgi:hypothetical protein
LPVATAKPISKAVPESGSPVPRKSHNDKSQAGHLQPFTRAVTRPLERLLHNSKADDRTSRKESRQISSMFG